MPSLTAELKRHGLTVAPKLAMGDRSLGFWLALAILPLATGEAQTIVLVHVVNYLVCVQGFPESLFAAVDITIG